MLNSKCQAIHLNFLLVIVFDASLLKGHVCVSFALSRHSCSVITLLLPVDVCVGLSWSVHTVADGSVKHLFYLPAIRYGFIFRNSDGSLICTHNGEIFHSHNGILNVDKYNIPFHGFMLASICIKMLYVHASVYVLLSILSSCHSFLCVPLKRVPWCVIVLQPGRVVCECGVSTAWSLRRLIPRVLQVQRDQCGENPAGAAGAQAAQGHQQSEGIKGLRTHA